MDQRKATNVNSQTRTGKHTEPTSKDSAKLSAAVGIVSHSRWHRGFGISPPCSIPPQKTCIFELEFSVSFAGRKNPANRRHLFIIDLFTFVQICNELLVNGVP